ncbi:hypothetical protein EG347_17195 [Chryseobacterium sp. G0186]|nr:hypothetical protein EG347_17195 [Chryseobacterium sp. G0186]
MFGGDPCGRTKITERENGSENTWNLIPIIYRMKNFEIKNSVRILKIGALRNHNKTKVYIF